MVRKAVILGAAGRDFHNFNVFFRDNPNYRVVAFTATQIPFIANRTYPPELAGPLYPDGIRIYDENELPRIIREYNVDDVFFSYSDVPHEHVMHLASIAMSCGTSFHLLGPKDSMIKSSKPVVAVTATRTGAGKSTVCRFLSLILGRRLRLVIVRHPMVYGSFGAPVQKFATYEDLDKYGATIEEREEFEQHLDNGFLVYSGIDYERVLREAEEESDLILWDGGNNDVPFYKPDVHITVADPLRADDAVKSYPGEVNFRSADILVINKVNIAERGDVEKLESLARELNPKAKIIRVSSEIRLKEPELVRGKRAVVVEDGPTVTHGGLSEGAGSCAVRKYGGVAIDPRPFAVGSICEAYRIYVHMGNVVPALGYSPKQIKELEETLNASPADVIVLGTPSNLARFMKLNKPVARVRFELVEEVEGSLESAVTSLLKI